MRICDLTTLYIDGGEGGVNTYLLEKSRYLSRAGRAESHVIVVPGERDEERSLFGARVITLKSPRLPGNPQHRVLASFGEVRRILERERPDVVEVDCAYLLGGVAAGALRGRNVPIVGFYHVHLPTFIARPSAARLGLSVLPDLAEGLAWRYVRHCIRTCDTVVVSSRDIRDRLRARGFERIDHVPLGVNLELFRPGAAEARVRNGTRTILSVGRLSREKSLDVLLDAFRRLAARVDYRLVIVGDGPLRGRLEHAARDDARIVLSGLCPHGEALARIYASADVYVAASPNETFGLAVLEALASGVPVVGVRQGGVADLVKPAVGELAEPGNAADLAEKIDKLAQGAPRVDECRRYVEESFSWERTFDRLLQIYERVIAERRLEREAALAASP